MYIILILLNLANAVMCIKIARIIEDKKIKKVCYIISAIWVVIAIINFIHLWYK